MKVVLFVAAALAVCDGAWAQKAAQGGASVRDKRSYDQWLDIIAQYARRGGGGGGSGGGGSPWQPFPVDLPIAGADGRHTSLPVLVLPVPVPVPDLRAHQECNANIIRDEGKKKKQDYEDKSSYPANNNIDVRHGSYDDDFDNKPVGKVSTDHLVQLFREQQPSSPHLPPALVGPAPQIVTPAPLSAPRGFSAAPESSYLTPARAYLPPARSQPSPPRFDRSCMLRGFLTVHRADYTESYTAWYDARSGAARVEYHDGGATSYRSSTGDGRMTRVVRHTDRTGARDMVMCGVTSPTDAGPDDSALPALPNTDGFSFAGYTQEFGVRAEVWEREERGRAGELGAARGEELHYRHRLLVTRRGDDSAVPLKYTVSVDSSVLGPDCDGYEHLYSEYREQDHDQGTFITDTARECDAREQLDPRDPQHMARLEPLREFTMLHRDPRHDQIFDSYIKDYERNYTDDKELALRKNLLVQHTRFTASCNRQSLSFTVGANYLSDRLQAELEVLLGVAFSPDVENNDIGFESLGGERSADDTRPPREFDWRTRGGVTPVKFQGASCSSCWAFAVVGSVEGALFIQTDRLVELSEQTLVDCGHSHKAHGCNGTWPVAAFNYVRDRGLPARDEYTPYAAKVLKCKAPPVPPVTHIAGGVDVPPNNIEALQVAIRRYAPSVVVVDAHWMTFISYKSGVLQDDRCVKGPKKKLNHAVLAVGWGEQRGETHFILKNSWHEKWGEGGYIRVHAPSNTCGHLTTPSFARLRRENVDRLPGGA